MKSLLFVGACVLLGAHATAFAQREITEEQKTAAKAHFDAGKAHYEKGAYAEAVTEYLAAYKIAPLPELVFNIGQAYRLAGNEAEALRAYELFLSQQPQGTLPDEARGHVLELRSKGVKPSENALNAQEPQQSDPWKGFNQNVEKGAQVEVERSNYRARRFVVGIDYTNIEAQYAVIASLSAVGAYYYRLQPWAVFQPRVMLGPDIGHGVRTMDETPLGFHGEVQARILFYATPWLFMGPGLGVGINTCGRIFWNSGTDQRSCDGQGYLSAQIEIGVLFAEHYEISLAIHPISLAEWDGYDQTIGTENPVISPFGLSVSYHL